MDDERDLIHGRAVDAADTPPALWRPERDLHHAPVPAGGVMATLGIDGIDDEVEIGRGGFGVVYRGHQHELGREVAVKVLPANLDQRARDRFDRERRAMGSLSGHPNIVTVYSTGFTTDGRPYIVMEYLERGSMDDRVRRDGPVRWDEVADLGAALADAVQAAHDAGILHRDIKPANVLVSDRGEPKLADFGIARLEGAPETASSVITASIAHAAPEILDGKRPAEAADTYSLASTLYELLVGTPAFWRDTDESLVPMLARIAREPVPDLRAHGVPDPVAAAIVAGMAKDPADRPATAREFGESLSAALASATSTPDVAAGGQTVIVSTPPPRMDGAPAAPPASPAPPPSPAPPSPPPGAPRLPSTGAPPAAAPPPGPIPGATPPPGVPTGTGAGTTGESGGSNRNLLITLGVLAVIAVIVVIVVVVSGGGDDDGTAADGGVATTSSTMTGTSDPGASATLPFVGADDYPEYTTLFDASGAIRVSVPVAWDDVDPGAADPTVAAIGAATDIGGALSSFAVPGAAIQVTPGPLADADAALDAAIDRTGCDTAGRGDYADPLYTGRFEQLVNCGVTISTIWVVIAAPEDNAFSVVVSIQAVDARDESAARRVLDSFVVEPRAVPGL